MRRISTLFTALLLVGLYATEAKAQSLAIQVDSSVAKQITVTATVNNLPAGWTVQSVQVNAPLAGGAAGQGGQGVCMKQPDGTYKVTVFLKAGTYDVQGKLLVDDNNGNPQFPIFSAATKNVTVKAQ